MSFNKFSVLLVISLVALANSAPTEPDTTSTPPTETLSTTSAGSDASTPVPTSTPQGVDQVSASTTPSGVSDDKSDSSASSSTISSVSTSTTSTQSSSASEHASKLKSTNFTCFKREVGYYADIDLECRVYHFCLPGDFNGEQVYQRISYLCLNETTFDQQALDCVAPSKMIAPCPESIHHYHSSNKVLRQAIVNQGSVASSVSSAPTTTTPIPASAAN